MNTLSDAAGHIPWLTGWDEEMIAHLSSIASLTPPPKMQLLFFANTFPLAYHYALALRMKGLNPHEFIHIGLWNQVEGDDRIYYTNNSTGAYSQLVTVFNPRWVFVPLTLATSRIWESLPASQLDGVGEYAPQARDLTAFLGQAKTANYNQAWIYAELKELGDLVARQSAALFPHQKIFFWEDGTGRLPAFETSGAEEEVLRLFVFGGPLSSYLLRKTNRYLPLALPGGSRGDGSLPDSMRLFVVSGSDQSVAALDQYHASLYNKSLPPRDRVVSGQKCPPFFTVYRAYNELAWLLQHRSSFKDAEEFGLCLKQHHITAEGS